MVAILVVLLFVAYFYIINQDNNGTSDIDNIENTSNTITTSQTTTQPTDTPSGNTLIVSSSASASNNNDGSTLTIVVTLRANSVTTLDATKTTVLSGPSGVGQVATAVTSLLSPGDTSVTITFASGVTNTFGSGTYVINLSWAGEGDDSKFLEISVNV